MLVITDLNGNTEMLSDVREFKRGRKVNGDKTLTFSILPTFLNAHAFPMVDNESIVEFDGVPYVIKNVSSRNLGRQMIKDVTAVHKFFDDMINVFQYGERNGSQPFVDAVDFVFQKTNYTTNIISSTGSQTLEGFGKDNSLSLLQKLLETYKVEFRVVGNQVDFLSEIGNKTDFQFRWGHNVKSIEKSVDTTNLATFIRGYGKQDEKTGAYLAEAYYRSPNESKFGTKEAPAVYDDRYTNEGSLLERLRNDLIDEPEVSITIDFADLRAAGYPWTVPNEGDYGFIIYEPMDIDIEARIVEIEESYDENFIPIQTSVTLSNIKENMTDMITRFSNTSKSLERLMQGEIKLPKSALDDAVVVATAALQSAQTELEFENGIIAREKTNPNELVLFNSKGIGVSVDNGQTFKNAITSRGVVAETIYGGNIFGVNISSVTGDGQFNVSGGNAKFTNSDGTITISPSAIIGKDSAGNTRFSADQNFVSSIAFGTVTKNVYITSVGGEGRCVDTNGVPGDGEIYSYTYNPFRAAGIWGDYISNHNLNRHLYLGTDLEVRATSRGLGYSTDIIYRPVRASGFYGNQVIVNGGTNMYLGVVSSSTAGEGEVRVTNTAGYNNGSIGYRPIRASEYRNGSSIDYKTNIEDLADIGLSVINNLQVKRYALNEDVNNGIYDNWQVGLISEFSPEVATADLKSINLYKLLSYTVKAVQELSVQSNAQDKRISDLELIMGEM
ncbi:phage tail spike protein [Fictibacillus enclensis]|uniref:phage tail spike protein n=1 Tax=Fictibacillus enclensis TaxID=1017270 RepID=UPI0025A0B78E|nr:phage tail spike protein [Fictibacillus enclensis]MDM5199260.1 phage tail spike protein [Fictibacillus enclensis]